MFVMRVLGGSRISHRPRAGVPVPGGVAAGLRVGKPSPVVHGGPPACSWTEQIPGFLGSVALVRQDLLVAPEPWRLSGLIDFGAREYEFAAVGCFASEGDARFPRRITTAYGRWLRRLPASPEPTVESLADCWFGCG